MSDHSDVPITWDGDIPSPDVVDKVRSEIRKDLADLAQPTDLVFHTILLSDDWSGPSVCLWGRDDNTFGGTYSEATEWKSISSTDDDLAADPVRPFGPRAPQPSDD